MMTIRTSTKDYTDLECFLNAFKNHEPPATLTVEHLRTKRDFSTLSKQVQLACGLEHTMLEDSNETWEVLIPKSGNAEFAVTCEDFDYIISRPPTQELQTYIWNAFACESHTALYMLADYVAN